MLFLKLSETQAREFDPEPEAGMGLHFARVDDELGFILSGRVLFLPHTTRREGKEASDRLGQELWFGLERSRNPDDNALINALEWAPAATRYVDPFNSFVLGVILNPPPRLPPAPARPAHIYGHLPFTGLTQPGDIFYRCEHWTTSRRVLVGKPRDNVLAGTYGFPESETRFVPTGFAAVGRYALPDLPPACSMYQIIPPPGHTIECGASVPLYGQAGGGVEVRFPTIFTARVSGPTILPPL